MIMRQATQHDIEVLHTIYSQAIERLKQMQIDQWQKGYPNLESIQKDIIENMLYILEDNQSILAATAIQCTPEPTYKVIEGAWGNHDHNAITLHRVATASSALHKGTGTALFHCIKDTFPHHTLRIDTHRDNIPMISLLKKHQFVYRGIITLEDGSPRNAYDYIPMQV